MREKLGVITKKNYDAIKKRYEAKGYKVITKWRKGLKSIRLDDIVLREEIREVSDEVSNCVQK